MEVKKCKYCGAHIVWLKTQNGRPMPCNAAAVKYQENYKGKDVIVLSDGKVIKATVVTPNGGGLAPIVDGEGYISHFATCTHANEARTQRNVAPALANNIAPVLKPENRPSTARAYDSDDIDYYADLYAMADAASKERRKW